MDVKEALKLARAKFVEEQEDKLQTPTAVRYRRACEDYPAIMAVVHNALGHIFVDELRADLKAMRQRLAKAKHLRPVE